MNSNKQNLINKIVYRAQYRGTKEMDILLTSFVNSIIKSLSVKDLEDLNNVINMNDEDILRIANAEIINQDYKNNKIVELLINFKKKY
jgi:antitoxin CptB